MMLILKIAFRNIFRQKRRSLLTGLSLLGGYVLFSVAIGITEGTYSNIIDAFTQDHTGHVQIHRQGYLDRPSINRTIADPGAIDARLATLPEIVAFSPRVIGGALAYGNDKTLPVQVRGVDIEREQRTTRLGDKIRAGLIARSDGRGAFVGVTVARNLGLSPGSELVLISQAADGSVANDRYRVDAVIGTEESADARAVYLPLASAQDFFALGERVHEFAIRLRSHREAERVVTEIRARLGDLPEARALSVEPWQVVEQDFYRAMTIDKSGNVVSLGILMLIVAVGVLNAILMTILERTREYGVAKAIGTSPGAVFGTIVFESVFLAFLSVVAGFPLALAFGRWFERVGIDLGTPIDISGVIYRKMLGEVSAYTLFLPAIVVIATAIAASLWPAWKAARVRPIDALRGA